MAVLSGKLRTEKSRTESASAGTGPCKAVQIHSSVWETEQNRETQAMVGRESSFEGIAHGKNKVKSFLLLEKMSHELQGRDLLQAWFSEGMGWKQGTVHYIFCLFLLVLTAGVSLVLYENK